jgi:DNA-binding transcriptional ArsR family regulator
MVQKPHPDADTPPDLPTDDESDPHVERRGEFAARGCAAHSFGGASRRPALARGGHTDVLVLPREDAADLVTDRRLAILDHLREHDPDSVSALADALGYDVGDVSRDLDVLGRYDVTERVTKGRRKVPRLKHDHVVLEPLV